METSTAGDDAASRTAGDDAAPSEGSDAGGDSPVTPHESQGYDRKRAVLAAIPFLAIGLADLLLLLFWGLEPLWGFVILLPILFMSVLTYIAFRSGFLEDRT